MQNASISQNNAFVHHQSFASRDDIAGQVLGHRYLLNHQQTTVSFNCLIHRIPQQSGQISACRKAADTEVCSMRRYCNWVNVRLFFLNSGEAGPRHNEPVSERCQLCSGAVVSPGSRGLGSAFQRRNEMPTLSIVQGFDCVFEHCRPRFFLEPGRIHEPAIEDLLDHPAGSSINLGYR